MVNFINCMANARTHCHKSHVSLWCVCVCVYVGSVWNCITEYSGNWTIAQNCICSMNDMNCSWIEPDFLTLDKHNPLKTIWYARSALRWWGWGRGWQQIRLNVEKKAKLTCDEALSGALYTWTSKISTCIFVIKSTSKKWKMFTKPVTFKFDYGFWVKCAWHFVIVPNSIRCIHRYSGHITILKAITYQMLVQFLYQISIHGKCHFLWRFVL